KTGGVPEKVRPPFGFVIRLNAAPAPCPPAPSRNPPRHTRAPASGAGRGRSDAGGGTRPASGAAPGPKTPSCWPRPWAARPAVSALPKDTGHTGPRTPADFRGPAAVPPTHGSWHTGQ